ncbi:MAG TPA: SpoIIE family protein phosphatase [Micromonosporaceae bacterium]|nr:SpoIIE family protein phosphatase [Micromonosporaceae bacterium]
MSAIDPVAAPGPVDAAPADPRGATVLVVDDSRSKRYIIGSWLRRAGYAVREAETGAQALCRLADGPVDVVVLDVRLPDVSGYEVCERIKGDQRWAALPVLHVSANAVDVADRTQGLARGADGYLVEPIEPDELLATVNAMLRYYRARQHAERLARRLALLVDATIAVNTADRTEAVLTAAASGAAEIFQAAATAAAQTPEGERLVATVTGPGAEPLMRPFRPRNLAHELAATSPGTVARVALAPEYRDLLPWNGRFEEVWVTVARPKENRPAAYVTVTSPVVAREDVHILTQLGQAVAQAVEAMRSHDEERRTALTLQLSMLPREVPKVPGYDIAVRYEPATAEAAVGGDFYELARLDDELVVAIGDVAGHSLHAATVMAELRHALRAYLAEGHPPHAALDRLNALMLRWVPDEIASVLVGLLHPGTGRLRLACAGHMPPVLVRDGRAELVKLRGTMLGIQADRPGDTEIELPPGATLVLYTDGLVERRKEQIDVGLSELTRQASTVEPDLDVFCNRLLQGLAGAAKHDDVAVLALRRCVGTPGAEPGAPPARST